MSEIVSVPPATKKILVVDDDEAILHVMKILLTSQGFDVKTHATGYNVPEIVLHYQPNLIILDIRLPGKLGTEICSELKKIDTHLPIILFSADTTRGKAFSICAADSFIQKPFDVKQLLETVNSCLN